MSASFSLAVRGAAGACSGTYAAADVSSVSTTLPLLSVPLSAAASDAAGATGACSCKS
jgi:hypothetical protein